MSHPQSRFSGGRALLALFTAVLVCQAALAEDEDERRPVLPLSPKYQQECAACHLAYPPDMLPPTAWQRLMKGLTRHFGTDASLDPATTAELSAWLNANGARQGAASELPPDNRISRSSWFVREHSEVPAAAWKRPAIKSASNCAACHTAANQGDFNEHSIRIPR
jgi:mono/diheme cytochrome c family protein